MSRSLLIAEYTVNSAKFGVGTVHLESLGSAPLRKEQLRLISKHMQGFVFKTYNILRKWRPAPPKPTRPIPIQSSSAHLTPT